MFFRMEKLMKSAERIESPGGLTTAVTQADVEKLAAGGAPDEDIADLLDISRSRLRKRFGRALRRGRASLRVNLRRGQLVLALGRAPDVRMLLWLGRQYLGQKDDSAPPGAPPLEKTYLNVDTDKV